MPTNDFLSRYPNRKIKYLTIPGSHDAGLSGGAAEKLGILGLKGSRVVTQSDPVRAQAENGSRFFDVRAMLVGGQLKTYHSMKKPLASSDSKSLGGSGQGFLSVFDELKSFVNDHPSEFVIVRLSHLRDTKAVFQGLADWIGGRDSPNFQSVYKGGGNLANKRVSELAGQIVIVVENKKLKQKNAINFQFGFRNGIVPGQGQGFHALYQNKKGKPLPDAGDGLCICGEFSNKSKLGDIVKKQITNYGHHDTHGKGTGDQAHLYCLYWTATGGNIRDNTAHLTPQRFNAAMDDMLKRDQAGGQYKWLYEQHYNEYEGNIFNQTQNVIRDHNNARRKVALNTVQMPNIVLYDFINTGVSNEIIRLNEAFVEVA